MATAKNKRTAQLFKALGHPVRIQIVQHLLKKGECYCGDITKHLPVAASTASQHLSVLKNAGIISGRIEGLNRCYCVNEKVLEELKEWMEII